VGRIHLFEFHDQTWCPAPLRDAATAYLFQAFKIGHQATPIVDELAPVLDEMGTHQLLDLCSGGGGPMPLVVDEFRERGIDARATLTDRFPNLPRFRRIVESSKGAIDYREEPVDAIDVPAELKGVRTLFNSFHHFRPEEAKGILRSASDSGRPIAVFELVGREPLMVLSIFFVWIPVLLLMPFIRPVRFSWLFFTYVIPLIPLLVVWDGLVSCFRIYSVDELEALVAEIPIDPAKYRWRIGQVSQGKVPAKLTFLVGMPVEPGSG